MHIHIHAGNKPDKPAYIMEPSGEVITYAQLEARSNQVAHLMRRIGLERGDSVAIFMDNTPHYFEICWAVQRSGVCMTPISSRLTASEVDYIIRDCGARVLFTSDYMSAVATELRGLLPAMVGLFMCGEAAAGFESYEAARDAMPSTRIGDESRGTDMLYSSGTTGRPKGIYRGLAEGSIEDADPLILLIAGVYGFDAETRYLSPAPLYHAAPLRYCMGALQLGGTIIVMENFDPELALGLIGKHEITHSQWVPTMFVRMLKLPESVREGYDVSSLRIAIHAAAPCPVPIKRQMLDWWGDVIYEYYAGSEGSGFTAISPQEWRVHEGSVGRPLIGIIHICDEAGHELPAGEAGVIYFENPDIKVEYHNDPEKTAQSHHEAHSDWSTLGDIGRVDSEGYLYLTDRKSFMIISGGVNIYPQETEDVLITHPKVADVAVIGVPNEEFGEEVKAVIQPAQWSDAGPALGEDLIAFCREHLSAIKCPRSVDFEAALPRHPTGKLYKRLLRDRYWGKSESKIV